MLSEMLCIILDPEALLLVLDFVFNPQLPDRLENLGEEAFEITKNRSVKSKVYSVKRECV